MKYTGTIAYYPNGVDLGDNLLDDVYETDAEHVQFILDSIKEDKDNKIELGVFLNNLGIPNEAGLTMIAAVIIAGDLGYLKDPYLAMRAQARTS